MSVLCVGSHAQDPQEKMKIPLIFLDPGMTTWSVIILIPPALAESLPLSLNCLHQAPISGTEGRQPTCVLL